MNDKLDVEILSAVGDMLQALECIESAVSAGVDPLDNNPDLSVARHHLNNAGKSLLLIRRDMNDKDKFSTDNITYSGAPDPVGLDVRVPDGYEWRFSKGGVFKMRKTKNDADILVSDLKIDVK